ncbi:hypothetical protein AB6A40_003316 [Gnathostoma spinigerum]|uniref:FERM domain-containing protein n=1 Tax=Gnathostoma spinigerum TaxID=75299 RepID=A0ABD6EIW6_9BILA
MPEGKKASSSLNLPSSSTVHLNGHIMEGSSQVSSNATPSTSSSLGIMPYASTYVRVIPSLNTSVASGLKYLQVQTLTKETITLAVNLKCKVRDVYLCCCAQLGISDDRCFGLARRTPSEGFGADRPRHEYFFLDPEMKLSKYAPKQRKLSHAWSPVVESRPFLVLHLRVRIYVDKVRMMKCRVALRHYYLQLRENLIDLWSGVNSVSEERCWEMAALALQADESDSSLPNFRAEEYFPMWVINLRGLNFIGENIRAIHGDGRLRSHIDSALEFCTEASRSPFALNCHLYGLRRHKMDAVDNAIIGITPRGIEMCDVGEEGERIPLRSMRWRFVTRLSFDRRKLTISGVDGTRLSLYAETEQKARYILEFCRIMHQALIQINNSYHDAGSDDFHLAFATGDERSTDERTRDCRSAASNASSNSTSGVVSDKPSSEVDKELEWVESSTGASDSSCPGSSFTPSCDEPIVTVDRVHSAELQEVSNKNKCSFTRGRRYRKRIVSRSNEESETSGSVDGNECEETVTPDGFGTNEKHDWLSSGKINSRHLGEIEKHHSLTVSSHESSSHSVFPLASCSIQHLCHSNYSPDLSSLSHFHRLSPIAKHRSVEEDLASFHISAFQKQDLDVMGDMRNLSKAVSTEVILKRNVDHVNDNFKCPLKYREEKTSQLSCTSSHLNSDGLTKRRSEMTGLHFSQEIFPTSTTCGEYNSHQCDPIASTSNFSPVLCTSRYGLTLPVFFPNNAPLPSYLTQCSTRAVNRAQSMPAHSPRQHIEKAEEDMALQFSRTALHHAYSLNTNALPLGTKQPPPYEHAIQQRHSYGNENEDLTLNSRMRQFPMMRALWQEQQGLHSSSNRPEISGYRPSFIADSLKPCSSASPTVNAITLAQTTNTIFDNEISHSSQRPSSCQNLFYPTAIPSTSVTTTPSALYSSPISFISHQSKCLNSVTSRGEYCPQNSSAYSHKYTPCSLAAPSPSVSTYKSWSSSVMDLPPPPPYPPPRPPASAREAPLVV